MLSLSLGLEFVEDLLVEHLVTAGWLHLRLPFLLVLHLGCLGLQEIELGLGLPCA